jgi:hypothetical protein
VGKDIGRLLVRKAERVADTVARKVAIAQGLIAPVPKAVVPLSDSVREV